MVRKTAYLQRITNSKNYQDYKEEIMEDIEKARIMLRIKMMQEVKNKVPMEERILFKALTKEQQILFLERSKQKNPLK